MKIFCRLITVLAGSVLGASAQTINTNNSASVPAYQVVQQDANTRVWQRQINETGPNGEVVPQIQSFTEIASGLNYLDTNGQWQPASEQIDIQADGTAAAIHGQHQVYFPVDILNGNIEMVTPDGKQVKSQPAALAYDDGSNSVLIAVLTNSVGQVVGENQVIYTNAFSGINADLSYTYRRGGFEQDVILHESPPTPESLGLDPNSTRLEMLTEFLGSSSPVECTQATVNENGMGMTDSTLDFGQMQMVPGKAFKLGENTPAARVCKSWVTLEGRHFLVEQVPVVGLTDELDSLPMASAQAVSIAKTHLYAHALPLPPQHWAKNKDHSVKLVRANMKWRPGVVLDYNTINTSLTNYTFQGDTTYDVSGAVNLYGTNTFEGGAIIKYTNNASISLMSPSEINWQGAPYRPVVFTAKDDNSVGVPVAGSTGVPSGYYAADALDFSGSSAVLNNVRIAYAQQAFRINAGDNLTLYNVQVVDCGDGINWNYSAGSASIRNAIFVNVQKVFNMQDMVAENFISSQNCTFVNDNDLTVQSVYSGEFLPTNSIIALTNCILANVTNSSFLFTTNSGIWFVGTNNGAYNLGWPVPGSTVTAQYPFQIVGGGSYYLTNNSSLHNIGTTNIDPILLDDLNQKTTYAPTVYSGIAFYTNTLFGPIAARDTSATPDLGYHYDPVDYVFGGCDVYTNMTFTNGAAVGWFYNYGGISAQGEPYAISLNDGANLSFSGNATAPCWMAHSTTVQEGCNGSWTDTGWMSPVVLNGDGLGLTPQLNSYFTKWSVLGGDIGHFQDNWAYGEANIADSEFYIANITTYRMSLVNFSNCLFYRSALFLFDQDAAPTLNLIDGTFYNGIIAASRTSGQNPVWTIQNTTFDGTGFRFTDVYGSNPSYTHFNYNAYNTNNLAGFTIPFPYGATTNYLEVIGPNDIKTGGFNWQNSWLGNFYLPTNSSLIQAGSTNANLLGLYYYTTQTNQLMETNAIVDVGYHYVSAYPNGVPYNSDADGVPNYLEDLNPTNPFTGVLTITITSPTNGAFLQ